MAVPPVTPWALDCFASIKTKAMANPKAAHTAVNLLSSFMQHPKRIEVVPDKIDGKPTLDRLNHFLSLEAYAVT
jgi:hypothetical protein